MNDCRVAIVDFLCCPRCGDFIVDEFRPRKFRPTPALELRFPLCGLCATLPDYDVFMAGAHSKVLARFQHVYALWNAVDFMDEWENENE